MKKIVVYNKLIPFKGYVAMAVFPFICPTFLFVVWDRMGCKINSIQEF